MRSNSRAVSVLLVAILIALVGCSISAFRTDAQTTYRVLLRAKHQDLLCFDIGTIVVESRPYVVPTTLAVDPAQNRLRITAVLVPGCDFVMWELEGPLVVRSTKELDTLLTVNGDGGTLRLVYKGTCCRYVGGVVPTNSYMALAPYLAVIGLIATAAVAVRKRRD